MEKKDTDKKKRKKLALGRGLDALIPSMESSEKDSSDFFLCDITKIQPNRYQPRIKFSQPELEELSNSIKEKGIVQPLLVRQDLEGYELIAGERRLRAAKLAGLTEVPVVVKNISDTDLLEISIIENIQRENLNPLEEADAYYRLINEFNLTQEEAAQRVGKSRPAVANLLRLRNLPEQIKESIMNDAISMGHARALLGAESEATQIAAWRVIMSKNLSVRETEILIKRLKTETKKVHKQENKPNNTYFSTVAEDLSRQLGTKVLIDRKGQKGKMVIEFYSDDDLDRLIQLFQ